MVDVFRKSEDCLELAKETIKINAKIFWMQIGIFNQKAYDLILKTIYNVSTIDVLKLNIPEFFGELGSGGFYTNLISSRKEKIQKTKINLKYFLNLKI